MLYLVDNWSDYVFVFNTDCSSYRLVLNEYINGVDLPQLNCNPVSIYKLRMLYNLVEDRKNYFTKFLVQYQLMLFDTDTHIYWSAPMVLLLNIFQKKEIAGNYTFSDDYIAFVSVHCRYNTYRIYSKVLQDVYFPLQADLLHGVPIPFVMIDYIFSLVNCKRFDLIMESFDGLFYEKLMFKGITGSIYTVDINEKPEVIW